MSIRRKISRLNIPRVKKSILPRPRLMTIFSEISDYSMAVVRAGAGYGKTTAMSNYAEQSGFPVFWLTLTEEERDPAKFIVSFVEAFMPANVPKQEIDSLIEAVTQSFTWESAAHRCAELINTYLQDESIFVFDDFHVLDEERDILGWLEQWVRRLTGNIHLVLITRTEPALSVIREFRMHSDVLTIRERDLVFTDDEISFMFEAGSDNGKTRLHSHEVRWLKERTGGMAIVLHMIWREWRQHHSFEKLRRTLEQGKNVSDQIGQLFLAGVPNHLHHFYRFTSVLDELQGEICDFILDRCDSEHILIRSEQNGFIALNEQGNAFFLHPLVRDYLESTLTSAGRSDALWKSIHWFQEHGKVHLAVRYLFALKDQDAIMRELALYIPLEMKNGHVLTVRGWLDRLNSESLQDYPELIYMRAEVARLTNQFSYARHWYEAAFRAAMSKNLHSLAVSGLMGQARFYLDTIQPALANPFIIQANRILRKEDRSLRMELLELTYENSINLGMMKRAARLQGVLRTIGNGRHHDHNVDSRMYLRLGKWESALSLLKTRVEKEDGELRIAHFHREATLIVSLIYSFMGEAKLAELQALRGYHVGDFLQAPFVRAVGSIRLGHAKHLQNPLSIEALQAYQTAIDLMEEMEMARGKAEAYLGLCLAYGYQGEMVVASTYAEQGIKIASEAGDLWMTNIIRLACGQVYWVNQAFVQTIEQMDLCIREFRRCGDCRLLLFGYLWRAMAKNALSDGSAFEDLEKVFDESLETGYDEFWYRSTFFGLRDIQQAVPLLKEHQKSHKNSYHATHVLERLRCEQFEDHPGYTLRVKTLGAFRAWRGFVEITRKDWQREKAKQLFQFLLCHRGVPLYREQITEQLWGDVRPEIAERDFKVALNALATALYPKRVGRGLAPFIEKMGGAYQLTSHPILVVDQDEFLEIIRKVDRTRTTSEKLDGLRTAMNLYDGDFLPDARYELWSEAVRERLRNQYMRTAEIYVNLCMDENHYQEALDTCVQALRIDPTWESFYVTMMKAYAIFSNRSMIIQSFQTCKRVLLRELGVDVASETRMVYESLIK